MVICIVNTTFFVTETPPRRDSARCQIATSPFSIFIDQNTKSTTGLNIHNILEERPQDVIFEYIFKNMFLYPCFFNIDYRWSCRYVDKHVEGNIKNSCCICIVFLGDVQRTYEKCP